MVMAWHRKVIGEIDKDKQAENISGLFHTYSNKLIFCDMMELRE